MLGLKLNHVSKRGHKWHVYTTNENTMLRHLNLVKTPYITFKQKIHVQKGMQ